LLEIKNKYSKLNNILNNKQILNKNK